MIAACLGIAFTITIFLVVRGWEGKSLEEEFNELATERARQLGHAIDQSIDAVHSVGGLFAASSNVERHEFREFVGQLRSRHPETPSLGWAPRVVAATRRTCDEAARKDGFSVFQIWEQGSRGEVVPAAERAEYFPLYFLEPIKGEQAALGFDLASEWRRCEAMERARDSGLPVATARLRLVDECDERFGCLIFLPVFEKGLAHDTVADRRRNLRGFARVAIQDVCGRSLSTWWETQSSSPRRARW